MTVIPRSHALVARNQENLEQCLAGRFIREASDDSLARRAFARYLSIEEQFVKTAVRVSAFTLFAEPEWASISHHAATIEALLGTQLDYFHETRSRHTDVPEDIARAVKQSSVLSDYVLDSISTGGYAGAIVNMFAAETLYLEWCSRAAASRVLNPEMALDAWIDLHVSPAFKEQVRTLGALVDLLPEHKTEGGASDDQLDSWFRDMLSAEDSFHDAIYFTGE
jgi:thiaminase/transcriptional activator TenA